jgi:hypothetical protein
MVRPISAMIAMATIRLINMLGTAREVRRALLAGPPAPDAPPQAMKRPRRSNR